MASGSSSSSESSVSSSSTSLFSISSSHFPATSSSPFAPASSSFPFGPTTTRAFSFIVSSENPASMSKSSSSSPKIFDPSKPPSLGVSLSLLSSSGGSTSIAMSSTSSVSHATISSNLFSSSSNSDSPFSTVSSVQNSASGLTTIAASSSDSAQSSSVVNSSSSPASDFVAKSTSPSPLFFSTVTSASTTIAVASAIASVGTANSFAESTLSASKLTAPSPLFSTVTATSASAPSAVASSSLVSPSFGVDSSPCATAEASTSAVLGSVSSFTAATTSAPTATSQAQFTTTTAPLSRFCFQNSSSSFSTPSLAQSLSASTSGFSLVTSTASTSSFLFGTSSSAPFQSTFSLKNVAPPTSNIFAVKSTSSLPLFSTITANASTPTAVASGTAASMISSPAFGVSSFSPATTASTNGFSRTTSSLTGFGGGNKTAAFGGFNSFTEFSTKISGPTSTSQTQSTASPLLCQPSRGSFLPVQTTKNNERKRKHRTSNGQAPGFKHCAENVESSPQPEVPSKSFRLSAEASRKTTPQLTPANGNSGKKEENYSKGIALQEIPSLGMQDLDERTTLQHAEVQKNEKGNFEGNSPSDTISKAFKDCASVMSSLADLDAHIKNLSEYKAKYYSLKSEMEVAAIAWKDKEEFLVQVHRNLYDEIKALKRSNQSLKFSNNELDGKCKQKDSQIDGLERKVKGISEDLSWKEKQLSLSVKEEELRGIRRLTQYQTLMINEIIKKYPKVDVEDLKRVYCPKVEGELIKLSGQASNEPQGTKDVAQDL